MPRLIKLYFIQALYSIMQIGILIIEFDTNFGKRITKIYTFNPYFIMWIHTTQYLWKNIEFYWI